MPHRRFCRVVECRETAGLRHFNLIRMAAGQYMHAQQSRALLMALRGGGRIHRRRVVQVTGAANGSSGSWLRAGRWSRGWCCCLCNALRRRRGWRRDWLFGHLRLGLWLGRHRSCRWLGRGGHRFGWLYRRRWRRRRWRRLCNRRRGLRRCRRHGRFRRRDHLHGDRHRLSNGRQRLRRHVVQQEKSTHMRAQRDDADQRNVTFAERWHRHFRQRRGGSVE